MSDWQELYRRLERLITLLERVVELQVEVGDKPETTCDCHSFGTDGDYIMKLPVTEVQHD